jgi:hypothetical protein
MQNSLNLNTTKQKEAYGKKPAFWLSIPQVEQSYVDGQKKEE